MDSTTYTHYIDFAYTTLLMLWGGSLVGIGLITVPFIFHFFESTTEAAKLTSQIFRRQDLLIRVMAVCMLILFYFKSKLDYTYQYGEWVVYVGVLHFFIAYKVISRRLWKIREKIETFDTPVGDNPMRKKFNRWHMAARILYTGQIAGVVLLLYLHAFGL
ncbi:MAG: hypothetical protein ACE5EN_06860 [Nitrospinota bacterium]